MKKIIFVLIISALVLHLSACDLNSNGGDDSSSGDTGVKFITVTDVTRMRIKGNISELNAWALMEGMEMRIRSRTDETQTWMGTISLIDWENPVQENNN